jgi:superkiller protein 3
MRKRFWLALALAVSVAIPAFAQAQLDQKVRYDRDEAKAQVDFGITVAQRGLWKEAVLRFEKAVKADPTYAAAWNDLGVGLEQLGRFDEAREAYEKANALEPDNKFIITNYDLFREIYDRQNRRRGR